MNATATRTYTVEEFLDAELPDDSGWILIDGEAVGVTFPALRHTQLQTVVYKLLDLLSHGRAFVTIEMPFRLPGNNLWRADVGATRIDRLPDPLRKKVFEGSPDLVIEILSPSNTKAAIAMYRRECMKNGTEEFWVVNDDARTVTRYTREGGTVYGEGSAVPVALFGNSSIDIDRIFQQTW